MFHVLFNINAHILCNFGPCNLRRTHENPDRDKLQQWHRRYTPRRLINTLPTQLKLFERLRRADEAYKFSIKKEARRARKVGENLTNISRWKFDDYGNYLPTVVDAFEVLRRKRAKGTAQAERQTGGKKMKQETNSAAGSFGGLKLSVDRCIPSRARRLRHGWKKTFTRVYAAVPTSGGKKDSKLARKSFHSDELVKANSEGCKPVPPPPAGLEIGDAEYSRIHRRARCGTTRVENTYGQRLESQF